MARDPLISLLRLRRAALDEAAREVAACLAREHAADEGLARAERAIAHETETARVSSSDAEVEAFAKWLPRGRQAVAEAEAARGRAARESELARAALTLARGAVEATELLIEQRAAAQRQLAERQAQAALDEVGARRSPQDPG